MPRYVVSGPDGSEYEVEGEGSEEQALAAFKQQWESGAVKGTTLQDHWKDPWYKRLGTAVGDTAGIAAQGLSLGFSDEAIAGVRSLAGTPYEQAHAEEEARLQRSKTRVNAGTPGSAEALEIMTSAVNPLGRAKGLLGLGGLAVAGGVSAYGHGERDWSEIGEKTALGGIMGLGRPAAQAVAKYSPTARLVDRFLPGTTAAVANAVPQAFPAAVVRRVTEERSRQ